MKALRLFCWCGAVKLFKGQTTDELLTAIDTSGWVDRAYLRASKQRMRGECLGTCPMHADQDDPRVLAEMGMA